MTGEIKPGEHERGLNLGNPASPETAYLMELITAAKVQYVTNRARRIKRRILGAGQPVETHQ
jgi:hypothetical protein